MTNSIQKALCSINTFLMEFHTKWAKELQGIDSSLKKVPVKNVKTPQKIAGRNPGRTEIWIHNAGDQDLCLAPFVGEIDQSLYSIRIKPKDTLIMSSHNYAHLFKEEIQGFWDQGATANSYATITEFYLAQ